MGFPGLNRKGKDKAKTAEQTNAEEAAAKEAAEKEAAEKAAQEQAATKIQAIERGKRDRKKVADKKAEQASAAAQEQKEDQPQSPVGDDVMQRGGAAEGEQDAAASPAAEEETEEPEQAQRCACGNVFMDDSMFCRKCGADRRDAPPPPPKRTYGDEIPYEEAVQRVQEGDLSFKVLAALTRKRDQMLMDMEEDTLDELMTGHNIDRMQSGQLDRSELHVKFSGAMKRREIRRVFLQFCRDRRGCGFRAWRLDIDLKGTNRVPYTDFTRNVMYMGLSLDEAMAVWHAYRPRGQAEVPLHFHEFDPAEWANLNGFLELLWKDFNFDMDIIWSYFDTDGGGSVDFEEFEEGMKKIGFRGHVGRIFYGLDTAAGGRLWKETMHYLFMVQPESHTKPEDSPLIREVQAWLDKQFGSAGKFCDTIGLVTATSSMSIHSVARKLTELHYAGNCLHTAIALSSCNQFVTRSDIIKVLGKLEASMGKGRKESLTYAGRCIQINTHCKDQVQLVRGSEKPDWNYSTYNPCAFNKSLGSKERHVFSIPFPRPLKDDVLDTQKKVVELQVQQRKASEEGDTVTYQILKSEIEKLRRLKARACPNGHVLVKETLTEEWRCGAILAANVQCRSTGFTEGKTRMRCAVCDFDICKLCYRAQALTKARVPPAKVTVVRPTVKKTAPPRSTKQETQRDLTEAPPSPDPLSECPSSPRAPPSQSPSSPR